MYDQQEEGFWGCLMDVIELVGLFLALTWPLLILTLLGD